MSGLRGLGDCEEVTERDRLRLWLSKGATERVLERERNASDPGVRDLLRERDWLSAREYRRWRCDERDREREGGEVEVR
jgi:hypothetical protein